jgi:multidrug transporter EmrE-like cation transporter
MSPNLLFAVLLSVAMSAAAQAFLKAGMSSPTVQQSFAGGREVVALVAAVLGNAPVLLGLTLYGLSAVLWLFVLARLDLSKAYPFVGLGFIATMVIGHAFFNEQVGAIRVLGTLLVACGVVMVARS